MIELNDVEINCVSGGGNPESGTISRPTRGESEKGREFNDLVGMLNAFGSWLGCTIWDLTNKPPSKK